MNRRRTGQPFWRRGDGDPASAARRGHTVIIVTHDPQVAAQAER